MAARSQTPEEQRAPGDIGHEHIDERSFPSNVVPFTRLDRNDPEYEAKKKSNILIELTHKLFPDGIAFPYLRRGTSDFETKQRINTLVEFIDELQELKRQVAPVPLLEKPKSKGTIKL